MFVMNAVILKIGILKLVFWPNKGPSIAFSCFGYFLKFYFSYNINTFSNKSVNIYEILEFHLKAFILPNNMCLGSQQVT